MHSRIFTSAMIFLSVLTLTWQNSAAQTVVDRSSWGAQPPEVERKPPLPIVKTRPNLKVAENRMRERKPAVYLTIHHTGAARDAKTSFKPKLRNLQVQMQDGYNIKGEDKDGKWVKHITLGDIPYHFFISMHGEIAEGRELKYSAYSNTNYQSPINQHITVVLEGNFNLYEPTAEQMKALVPFLVSLAREHNIRLENISYHKAVTTDKKTKKSETECPGRNLISKMDMIIAALKKQGIQ